jgi:2,4-dienoyl-CoA reductase (NADPH2)
MPRVQREAFVNWAKQALDQEGFVDGMIRPLERTVKESFDSEVDAEVRRGGHGVIMLCRNPSQPWRERALYKVRGRAVTLIGTHSHYAKVLVPVDLSSITDLVLMFLRQTHFGKPGFQFHFVHALSGPRGVAEQRWEKIKEVTGMGADLEFICIPGGGEIAGKLLKLVESGNYGTVVMGKRGLTGIKKWLLGSVSAGVLRGLKDQSLILID